MSRLGIRTRMAAVYAVALLVMLALAGSLVYIFLGRQLGESLDTSLEVRSNDLASLASQVRPSDRLLSAEEGFSQIVAADGEILLDTRRDDGSATPVLSEAELSQALEERLFVEREVPGVEGAARILARSDESPTDPRVVVVGASTDDRREALGVLLTAFVIGSPIAVLLASGVGYLIAGRSLRPVAAMRARAEQITLDREGERLPLPVAEDEIHQLGQTLNAMLERIEAGVARERIFVAEASHELRTPLAILRSELELAQRPGRREPELRDAISSAAEEVDRLTRLAEDLLVVARSDQGQVPLSLEALDTGELGRRVVARFERELARRGRTIRLSAEPDLTASADALRLEQALGNLIANAVQHGDGEVEVSIGQAGSEIALEVADQGPGFSAELASVAFDRFARGETGRGRAGAGLGLAIVRAIAEAHGGEARIRRRTPPVVGIVIPAGRSHPPLIDPA